MIVDDIFCRLITFEVCTYALTHSYTQGNLDFNWNILKCCSEKENVTKIFFVFLPDYVVKKVKAFTNSKTESSCSVAFQYVYTLYLIFYI